MNQQRLVDRSERSAQTVDLDDLRDTGPQMDPLSGLAEWLAVVRRNSGWLLLWLATCLALAVLYLANTTPQYVATTQIVLEPRRPVIAGSDAASGLYGPALDSAQADSQVQVVRSERVMRYVFNALNLDRDPVYASQAPGLMRRLRHLLLGSVEPAVPAAIVRANAFQAFSDRVSVRRLGQSYVLEVSFRASNGADAARLANAVTASYILDQIQFRAANVQRGTEFLQGRISDIKAEQDIAAKAVETGIIPDVQFADSDARVVSAALEPFGKSSPQTLLTILLALATGAVTGIGFITIRHNLDRTIRTRPQIGRTLGIDRLNVIPRFTRGSSLKALGYTAVLDGLDGDFTDAMRVLRTTILSLHPGNRRVAIGIASWSTGEGRSSIASNLAFLLGASRDRVTLIDADFHNPALSRALAADASFGLDNALLGHHATDQPLAVPLTRDVDLIPAVAGGLTGNQNVFIGSNEMQNLLGVLRAKSDIVVDLPPMALSSDTQAVGHLLDGVILIVEANRTRTDDLGEAIRALKIANARLLGVVLNKMPLSHTKERRRNWLQTFSRSTAVRRGFGT